MYNLCCHLVTPEHKKVKKKERRTGKEIMKMSEASLTSV